MPWQAELSSEAKVHFEVAAGILRDASGRVLIAERLGGGPFHGLWEFPGGKITTGESPNSALRRELLEELGIELLDCAPFMQLYHEYPDRTVSIEFFLVTAWHNEVQGLEGQRLEWIAIDELCTARLLPADLPVVDKLRNLPG